MRLWQCRSGQAGGFRRSPGSRSQQKQYVGTAAAPPETSADSLIHFPCLSCLRLDLSLFSFSPSLWLRIQSLCVGLTYVFPRSAFEHSYHTRVQANRSTEPVSLSLLLFFLSFLFPFFLNSLSSLHSHFSPFLLFSSSQATIVDPEVNR